MAYSNLWGDIGLPAAYPNLRRETIVPHRRHLPSHVRKLKNDNHKLSRPEKPISFQVASTPCSTRTAHQWCYWYSCAAYRMWMRDIFIQVSFVHRYFGYYLIIPIYHPEIKVDEVEIETWYSHVETPQRYTTNNGEAVDIFLPFVINAISEAAHARFFKTRFSYMPGLFV